MSMAGYKNAKAARIGFIGTGYDKKIFKNTNRSKKQSKLRVIKNGSSLGTTSDFIINSI